MSTKAELEEKVFALNLRIAELERSLLELIEQLSDSKEAYDEATGVLGNLYVDNRLLRRRLDQTSPRTSASDKPSLTPKEAQDLGMA